MVALDRIYVGDVLYDCRRQKQGNTRMSRMACWTVKIVSIDSVAGIAMASWNGNVPTRYDERKLKRLRRTPLKADRKATAPIPQHQETTQEKT
jgi:hypothetical protein